MNMRASIFSFATLLIGTCAVLALSAFTTLSSPEFGKVTYYANSFQGKKTANGELYDRQKLTCAHKSLPFGTILRVTRIDNNKSVDVRVNDRGPFAEGYVVDISYSAAEEIDLIQAGVAKVKVEVVKPEPPNNKTPNANQSSTGTSVPKQLAGQPEERTAATATKPEERGSGKKPAPATTSKGTAATATPKAEKKPAAPIVDTETYQVDVKKIEAKGFGIQLMSVENAENALREASKIGATFKNKVILQSAPNATDPTTLSYKIMVGPFKTRKEAEAQQKLATKKGYKKCFIVELGQ
jgi:rare lipoprotein A